MMQQLLRAGTETEPIAQATHFGWILSGPVKRIRNYNKTIPAHHTQTLPDIPTEDTIPHFWQSEQVEEEEPSQTQAEQAVEAHYDTNTVYLPQEQRYQVTLPRRTDALALGASRTQAETRFYANERSIKRRGIWVPFQEVIQGYIKLQHAEIVPATEICNPRRFYLPMHAVQKQSSSSTKMRAVFDGSATTTNGYSLNQTLSVGPTIQPTLTNILLKFRTYPIALNGDISKMFREIKLCTADKDLHRFLWRPTTEDPLQDYRMTRVTFGVSASPYLAVKTLQRTATDHGEDYPEASSHVFESFYVDDFLGGASTVDKAVQLYKDLRALLQMGGFNLRKWRSSSSEVMAAIPIELQESSPLKEDTTSNTPSYSKALGLVWNSSQDWMSPSISVPDRYTPTKRGIYSDVSHTYDILGWIAPSVVLMKMLYQQLWQHGKDWDEEVPEDLKQLHINWREELEVLTEKQLPRCYSPPHLHILQQELHGFCDASLKAYGAAVYCRTVYHDHPPVVTLVTAKTNVARIKPLTIPKLELCGAVLLTKLLCNTAKALDFPKHRCHAWSDSSIVLSWLDGNPREYRVFVSNRVTYILEHTSPSTWLHVPTDSNPADCASRGMMPRELLHHQLWWNGPDWLQDDPYTIPKQPPKKEAPLPEVKTVHIVTKPSSSVASQISAVSNNYFTTLAVAAWVWRFVDVLQHRNPEHRGKNMSHSEIRKAEHWLMKESQLRTFPHDRRALLKQDPLPPSSRLLSLFPFIDDQGLLRVGGRLNNSALSPSQQHPVILDGKDVLSINYFQHMHLALCHCGPTLLLCATGNRFHVVGARRLSRTVCSQCITCRRAAPRFQQQQMGSLPAPRVTPAKAFTHTGMDFAGPFTLKLGRVRKPVKVEAYLCIFVCLTFKAVHIEVVSSQTTEAFLAAFRRFVSRRNCPQHVYSDNGSNFVGASRQLTQLYNLLHKSEEPAIRHYLLTHHQVTWHHIPPRAPHFGGLWESAVRSTKKHLKRIMKDLLFTYEELATISCQVEACLNSRPLLPLTSHDQDGLATLTASHFLLYQTPHAYPEDPRIPAQPHLLRQWNLCQSVVHHFWTRWSREYLHTLQARTKWQRQTPNLQVGDIIILRADKTFACHWPLARIIEVFPGSDGLVRVATVKTATGTYKRPTVKMSLLLRPDEHQETGTSLPPGGCLGTPPPEEGQEPPQDKDRLSSRGEIPEALPSQRRSSPAHSEQQD